MIGGSCHGAERVRNVLARQLLTTTGVVAGRTHCANSSPHIPEERKGMEALPGAANALATRLDWKKVYRMH